MHKTFSKRGFTLIEILVATTILIVLTSVVAVSFQQGNKNARDAKRKADLEEIRGVLENYRLENGEYPDSVNEINGYEVSFDDGLFLENVSSLYLSRQYTDPKDDATYHYRYQLRNLPGCTYELSAKMEVSEGQACSACGYTDDTYYCLTD